MADPANYISLALDDYTIVGSVVGINKFAKAEKFVRMRIEKPAPELTDNNNLVEYGLASEYPHVYDFSLVMPLDDGFQLVQPMYDEHLWRINKKDPVNYNPYPLLIDAYQPYVERAPITRRTAPSPFNGVTYFGTANSKVRYFAQFYVTFLKQPEMRQDGARAIVHFSLQETEKKVTPL